MHTGSRCLALTLILSACGPGSGTASDEGAGTDGISETGSTSDTDTTPTTGGTSETDTMPTTGGTSEPAICAGKESVDPLQAVACEDYASEELGAAIEVGIVNKRDEVVYLRGFGNDAPGYLGLTGVAGGREVHAPFVCNAEPLSCDELLAGNNGGCLADDKLSPPIRIEAGARATLVWSPHVVFAVDLPETCGAGPDATCTAGRRATPGAYALSITYNHADGCTGMCTCEPGSDGSCVLDLFETTLSDAFVRVAAPYDGVCQVVDLVID